MKTDMETEHEMHDDGTPRPDSPTNTRGRVRRGLPTRATIAAAAVLAVTAPACGGGGGPDLTAYGTPSEVTFLEYPVLDVDETLTTLEAVFRDDVQVSSAAAASGAGCHAVLLDEELSAQVACGPVVHLGGDLGAQWDRYSVDFAPVYEQLDPGDTDVPEQLALAMRPGGLIERGTALGSLETLLGVDLDDLTFVDELPLPPAQPAGLIDRIDLVGYGVALPAPTSAVAPPLVPASDPSTTPAAGTSLVFPAGIVTLTGLDIVESVGSGVSMLRPADGEVFRLASFDVTGGFTYTLEIDGVRTPLAGALPEGLPPEGLVVSAPKQSTVTLQVSDGVKTQSVSLSDGSVVDAPALLARPTAELTWPIETDLRATFPTTTMCDDGYIYPYCDRYVETNLVVEGRVTTAWLTPHPRLVPPRFAYPGEIPAEVPFTWAEPGRAWLLIPGLDTGVYDAVRGNNLPDGADLEYASNTLVTDRAGATYPGTYQFDRNGGLWVFDVPEDFDGGAFGWNLTITWVDDDGRNRGVLGLDPVPSYALD